MPLIPVQSSFERELTRNARERQRNFAGELTGNVPPPTPPGPTIPTAQPGPVGPVQPNLTRPSGFTEPSFPFAPPPSQRGLAETQARLRDRRQRPATDALAALDVAAIPARIAGEGFIQLGRDIVSPTAPGGPTQQQDELARASREFQQTQGRDPSFVEFQRISEEVTPLPTGVRGTIQAVADPLNVVPGIGFTKLPRTATTFTARRATAEGIELLSRPMHPVRGGTGTIPQQAAARARAVFQPPPTPPVSNPANLADDGTQLLWRREPSEVLFSRVAGDDTAIGRALRASPVAQNTIGGGTLNVARQTTGRIAGRFDPTLLRRMDGEIGLIGWKKAIFEEMESGRVASAILRWHDEAKQVLGFGGIRNLTKASKVALAEGTDPDAPLTRTIVDMVEHPSRYRFTEDQRQVIKMAQDMLDQLRQDEIAEGVKVADSLADYWPRLVKGAQRNDSVGQRLANFLDARTNTTRGGARSHTVSRRFDFADDLVNAGFDLDLDPVTALTVRMRGGIKAMSNAHSERELQGFGQSLPRSLSHPVEAFGVAYDDATWKVIARNVDHPVIRSGDTTGNAFAYMKDAFDALRNLITSVDYGAAFIQGQALLYRNPVAWLKAWQQSLIATVTNPTNYIRANFEAIQEGQRFGAILRPSEFLLSEAGERAAGPATRLLATGGRFNPIVASNRTFQWYIFVGQTEMWKAVKRARTSPAVLGGSRQLDEKALRDLGRVVARELGTESAAIRGIRPGQQAAESMIFFASRFMRAMTTLPLMALRTGPAAWEARRVFGSMLVGGISVLTGMSLYFNNKLPNVSEPFEQDWMQVRIGNSFFSPFGPYHPYFRTFARIAWYQERGEVGLAAREFQRFLASKLSIPARTAARLADAWIYGEARTFEGEAITPDLRGALLLAKEYGPIAPTAAIDGIAEGRPEQIAEVVGIVPRGTTPLSQQALIRNDATARLIEAGEISRPSGTEYSELGPSDKAKVDAEADVAEVVARVPEPRVPTEDTLKNLNFENWELFKENSEEELRQLVEIAINSPDGFMETQEQRQYIRRKLQDLLGARFEVAEALLRNPRMQDALNQEEDPARPRSLTGLYRELYWSVDPPDIILDDGTTEPDLQAKAEARLAILREADERGADLGAVAERSIPVQDPTLQFLFNQYWKDQDTLRGYWESGEGMPIPLQQQLREAIRNANPDVRQALIRQGYLRPPTEPPRFFPAQPVR